MTSVVLSAAKDLGRGASCLAIMVMSAIGYRSPAIGPGYSLAALDRSSYLEAVSTSVDSRTGTLQSRRSMARTARFGVRIAGDTVIVSGDSLELSETTGGVTRSFDPGGFLGGQWKLFLGPTGLPRVVARPFVPDDIAEVNDVAAAMDDFFPRTPPALLVNASTTDTAQYRWTRLTDSAGAGRYRWTVNRDHEVVRTVADSVPLKSHEVTRESGAVVWGSAGVPLGWSRSIHTEVTSTIRGRTVQAVVEQRIEVRRGR